jgi:hypothetical protein
VPRDIAALSGAATRESQRIGDLGISSDRERGLRSFNSLGFGAVSAMTGICTDYPRASTRRGRGAVLASLCVVVSAFSAAPALASSPPVILSWSEVGSNQSRVMLRAEIDPEGLASEYALLLGHCEIYCSVRVVASGYIAAAESDARVDAETEELQPGQTYTYSVSATNSVGSAQSPGREFTVLAGGGEILQTEGTDLLNPENQGTPFERPQESWVGSHGEAGAQEALRKAREREESARERAWLESPQYREEQEHREIQAREARAHQQEAAEAAQRAAQAAFVCRVPSVLGDSLTVARAALHRDHCTLGRVARPRAHRRGLVVVRQSRRQGTKLPRESTISVILAPRRRRTKT